MYFQILFSLISLAIKFKKRSFQQILIKSASDLITLENPNYQFVAARLLLYSLRKQVIDRLWDHPHIYDHVKKSVNKGIYDETLLTKYQRKDFDRMENWINHERDYTFTYAGLRQVIDKYLVQDRSTEEVFETPQFMYMLISATIFQNYPKSKRMTYVQHFTVASNFFRNGITPVCCTSPPLILALIPLILPALIPIPALWAT